MGRLVRLGWKSKVLLILVCVAAYFTAAYVVLSALSPIGAVSSPAKAHAAGAAVPAAVARGNAAAADLVYHTTAVDAGIERAATASSPITRDLHIIHAATHTHGATKASRHPGTKTPAKAGKRHPKAQHAARRAQATGAQSTADARAIAALRRFAAIAARAEGALYDPSALRALLPQLGSAAARLGSAYAPHSGSG